MKIAIVVVSAPTGDFHGSGRDSTSATPVPNGTRMPKRLASAMAALRPAGNEKSSSRPA